MLKTYLFTKPKIPQFLTGFFPFYRSKSLICPIAAAASGKKLVWRNDYESTIKLTEAYGDKPSELGTFLFLRTREREMIKNRIEKKSQTIKYDNFYTTGSDDQILTKVELDLHTGFDHLREMLIIMKEKRSTKFPVAFAANTLYALEKNGLRNEDMYKNVLIPILKKKASYLHAEGLAGAIWALGQYNSKENELISDLLDLYHTKKFADKIQYVTNAKFNNEEYFSAEGTISYEFDSTKEFSKMYYQEHIVCLELYEGLKNLSGQRSLSKPTQSKIGEIIGDLESNYAITSDSYSFYKQISEGSTSPATY
jgi:hypothetical protein